MIDPSQFELNIEWCKGAQESVGSRVLCDTKQSMESFLHGYLCAMKDNACTDTLAMAMREVISHFNLQECVNKISLRYLTQEPYDTEVSLNRRESY